MTKKHPYLIPLTTFTLALFVRLLMLGKSPLGEFEAPWAYQAWQLSHGQISHIGTQAGYLTLTESAFALFGSTNFLARFWPAFAGSLLALLPFFFQKQLSQKAAFIMSLGLALDPGLVAASRLVGGPMLAVAFILLAIALFWDGKRAWSAFFGGMALLSGPSVWLGLLGIALTLGVTRLTGNFPTRSNTPSREKTSPVGLASAVGVVILLGTSFLRHPQGLSAWVSALPAFVQSYTQPSHIPPGRLLFTLLAYQPLALIFGLIAGLRGLIKGEKIARALLVWFLVTLGLALLYPARQVYDLAWSLIPLWGLAALELGRNFEAVRDFWVTRAQASSIFVLFVLAWLSFTTLIATGGGELGAKLQWGIMGATVVLIALITGIVTGEWSWLVARKGLVSGASAALGAYVLAAMIGAAYLRPGDPRELWNPSSGGEQIDLLQDSLADFALLENGRREVLEIIVLADNEALPWALRGFSEVDFRETVSLDAPPPVLITNDVDIPQPWEDVYRGQDFVLATYLDGDEAIFQDWKAWLAFRDAPLEKEKSILWVRGDLFPFIAEEEIESDEIRIDENLEDPFEE